MRSVMVFRISFSRVLQITNVKLIGQLFSGEHYLSFSYTGVTNASFQIFGRTPSISDFEKSKNNSSDNLFDNSFIILG